MADQQQYADLRKSLLDQRAGRLFNQCGDALADNVVLQDQNATLRAMLDAMRTENAKLGESFKAENAELIKQIAAEQNKNADLQKRIAAVEDQVRELRATG